MWIHKTFSKDIYPWFHQKNVTHQFGLLFFVWLSQIKIFTLNLILSIFNFDVNRQKPFSSSISIWKRKEQRKWKTRSYCRTKTTYFWFLILQPFTILYNICYGICNKYVIGSRCVYCLVRLDNLMGTQSYAKFISYVA